jgi:CHASE2 domain-containing sensor protein
MNSRQQRTLRLDGEKGVVALLLVLIALAVSYSGALERVDHLLFDLGQRFGRRPAADGIVIVAIDQDSLDTIGRWPWPRTVHARLLDALCAARPAVVGFDIAFSEPSAEAHADSALARAVAACGMVVLPLVMETSQTQGPVLESPPIAQLVAAAAGIGRVGVLLDEDGIARAVDLREGLGAPAWPLLAEELLRVARRQAAAPAVTGEIRDGVRDGGHALVSEGSRRLAFAGPPGSIARVSYALVLEGNVAPEVFTGKTVLVGATAVGLGDFLPTPVSAHAQPMPGVEIQANVWLSLRDERLSTSLPASWSALLAAVLAVVPLLWLPRLMPLPGLLASTLWVVVLGVVSALLPGLFQIWFAPTGALAAGFSAFPLWSWRRLEAARRHLDHELRQLRAIIPADGSAADSPDAVRRMGFEQRIAWVQTAQLRMQRLETQRNEALAFISHDLRSPLASAVQRLESAPLCASEQLLPALRRAQTMAEDFLRLARAEALERVHMKTVELAALLHQAADEVYSLARQRGRQINRLIGDDPVWVSGDFAALERCTINLLQNAVNYSAPGTPITIGLDRDRDEIRFWVENDGAELGDEQVARLFQRFSRGEHGSNGSAGTGLGLYYVRTVAEKHGGQAGAECAAGRIRFWVRLPGDERGVCR